MANLRAFFLILAFSGATWAAHAQRPYFVYIQTETQEPFFVQLNKKNISSSSVGHLVLPNLVNGTYQVYIGFPGQNTLQEYRIVVESADRGFLVRKFENGGYGIVDIQTSAVQLSGAARQEAEKAEIDAAIAAAAIQKKEQEEALKAEQAKAEQAKAEQAKAEQAKADSLKGLEKNNAGAGVPVAAATIGTAAVVIPGSQTQTQDPDTQKKAEAEKEAVKKDEQERAGTTATANPPVANHDNTGGKAAVVAAGTLSAAEIMRLQAEARRIDSQGKRDSVMKAEKNQGAASPSGTASPAFLDMEMTMPAADSGIAQAAKAAPASTVVPDSAGKALNSPAARQEPIQAEKVVVPAVVPVAAGGAVATGALPDSSKAVTQAPKNPNCTTEATDADIDMVIMLIKGEKDPDDGLEMAKKGMKIKCVQTAQVRKLALLFEGQEERYRLLDMAYRYTIDKQQYSSLSDLLTDPYFLNRFKAMLQ